MEFWKTFWAITLGVVFVLYAGLFLWVTFGGMSDIRAMLTSLNENRDGADSEDDGER